MGVKLTAVLEKPTNGNGEEEITDGNGGKENVDLKDTDESTQTTVSTSGESQSAGGSLGSQGTEKDPPKKEEIGKGLPESHTGMEITTPVIEEEEEEKEITTYPTVKLKVNNPPVSEKFLKERNEDEVIDYLEEKYPNFEYETLGMNRDKIRITALQEDENGDRNTSIVIDLPTSRTFNIKGPQQADIAYAVHQINNFLLHNDKGGEIAKISSQIQEVPGPDGKYKGVQLDDGYGTTRSADVKETEELITVIDKTAAEVYSNALTYLKDPAYKDLLNKPVEGGERHELIDLKDLGNLSSDFNNWPDYLQHILNDIVFREVQTKFGEMSVPEGPGGAQVFSPLAEEFQPGVPGLDKMDYQGAGGQGVQINWNNYKQAHTVYASTLINSPDRETFDHILERTKGSIIADQAVIAKEKIYNQAKTYLGKTASDPAYLDLQRLEQYNKLDARSKAKYEIEFAIGELEYQIVTLENNDNPTAEQNSQLVQLKIQLENKVNEAKKYGGRGFIGGWWNGNKNIPKYKQQELNRTQQTAGDVANILQQFWNAANPDIQLTTHQITKQLYQQSVFEMENINAIGDEREVHGEWQSYEEIRSEVATQMQTAYDNNPKPTELGRLYEKRAPKPTAELIDAKVEEILSRETFEEGVGSYNYEIDESGTSPKWRKTYGSFNEIYEHGLHGSLMEGFWDENHWKKKWGEGQYLDYKIWLEEKLEVESEAKGYFDLAYLNIDPSKIVKPGDIAERLGLYENGVPLDGVMVDIAAFMYQVQESGTKAIAMQWLGMTEEEAQEWYGTTARDRLNQIDKTINLVNNSKFIQDNPEKKIEYNKAQKNNFKVFLDEQTAQVTGGFIPSAIEFAAFELITGGIASPAVVARMPRLMRIIYGLGKEELKMSVNTADFGHGTGATFWTLGQVTGRFGKLFNSPLMQKYVLAGPLGAISLEANGMIEAGWDEWMEHGDFKHAYDETYGELIEDDDIMNRIISNTLMFTMYGVSHVGKSTKYDFAITKTQKNNAILKLGDKINGILDTYAKEVDIPYKKDANGKDTKEIDGVQYRANQFNKLREKAEAGDKQAQQDIKKVESWSGISNGLSQRLSIETQYDALDPWVRDAKTGEVEKDAEGKNVVKGTFEIDFNNNIMNPINNLLKNLNPKYKNAEVKFVNSNKDKGVRSQFEKDANGKDLDNHAQFIVSKDGNYTILLDLGKYTPGKPLHEITHLVFREYFKRNPNVKIDMTRDLMKDLENVSIGENTGKDLLEAIKADPEYGKKSPEVQGEEFIAFLVEFLSQPKLYSESPVAAGNLVSRVKEQIRVIAKNAGYGKVELNTVKDIIQVIQDFGAEASSGRGVSELTVKRLNQLGKISTSEIVMEGQSIQTAINNAKNAPTTKASREIVLENDKVRDRILESSKLEENKGKTLKELVTQNDKNTLLINNMPLTYSIINEYAKTVRAKDGVEMSEEDITNIQGELMLELAQYTQRWDPAKNPEFGAYVSEFLPKQLVNAMKRSGVLINTENGWVFRDNIEVKGESADVILEGTPFDANIASNVDQGLYEGKSSELIEIEEIVGTDNLSPGIEKVTEFIEKDPRFSTINKYNETPSLDIIYDQIGINKSKIRKEDGSFNIKGTRLKPQEITNILEYVKSQDIVVNGEVVSNKLLDLLPKSLDESGEATGIQNVLLRLLYNKQAGRVDMATTGSKAGNYEQIKKELSPEEFHKILEENPNALRQLVYQIDKAASNSLIRSEVDSVIGGIPENIAAIASGKSESLPSRLLKGFEEIGQTLSQEQLLEKLNNYLIDPFSLPQKERDVITQARISEYIVEKTGQGFVANVEEAELFTNEKGEVVEVIDFNRKKDPDGKVITPERRQELKQDYYDNFLSEVILDFLPSEVKGLKSSAAGGEGTFLPSFFKLVGESRGVGNKGSKIGQAVVGDLLNTKDLEILKEKDPELGKAWEKFLKVSDKFEPANSDALGEFQIGKVKKIIEEGYNADGSIKTREQKIKEIEEIFDLDIIDAARKFDYAITLSLQRWLDTKGEVGSTERAEAAKYLYQHYKMNTNAVMSDRALAPFTSIYIIDGPQTNVKFKGEHNKDSALNASQKLDLILKGEWNLDTAEGVQKGFHQTFMDKSPLDFIDKKLGVNNTMGDAAFAILDKLEYGGKQGWESKIYDFEKGMSYEEKLNLDFVAKELSKIDSKAIYTNSVLKDYAINAIENPSKSNQILLKTAIENYKNNKKIGQQNIDITQEVFGSNTKGKKLSEIFEGQTNIQNVNSLKRLHSARENAQRLGLSSSTEKVEANIFDLDDNVLFTESLIKYTTPDGKVHKLTPEEFNFRQQDLEAQGVVFDFSEFNKVIEKGKGPAWDNFVEAYAKSPEDTYIMTARSPGSREAIFAYFKSKGMEISMDNIITTEGTEVTEGDLAGENKKGLEVLNFYAGVYGGKQYNIVNFTDDYNNNVESVRYFSDQLGIAGSIYQTFAARDLSGKMKGFINLETKNEYDGISGAKASLLGKSKGKFKVLFDYSAEDFTGLNYAIAGKGAQGEAYLKFINDNVTKEYFSAQEAWNVDRFTMQNDYSGLRKQMPNAVKQFKVKNDTGFTNEQAMRVFLWTSQGKFNDLASGKVKEMYGLDYKDVEALNAAVENNPELKAFAEQLLVITKGSGWSEPNENWQVGGLERDFELVANHKRETYFATWKNNVDQIYNEDVMNMLVGWKGQKYVDNLKQSLDRQYRGTNRLETGTKLGNRVVDFWNGSTATIMYYNTRSALLQTISAANYMNFSFNNPYNAGKALTRTYTDAEGKKHSQYWADVVDLWGRDFLTTRRGGLKFDVAADDIAGVAEKGGIRGVFNYMLQRGYDMTKFADSFAIVSGGATFYRNRTLDLMKNNPELSLKDAEEIAYEEFKIKTGASQQSADAFFISSQQSSNAGRIMLSFANTPMQYVRLQKRAFQDLMSGRGDAKENVGKIAYYSMIQNALFNWMQQAIFTEEDMDEAQYKMLDGMLDSQLRGLGIVGNAVAVGKDFAYDIYKRSDKSRPEYADATWKLTKIAPAVGSKLDKIKGSLYNFEGKTNVGKIKAMGMGDPLSNPAYEGAAKMIDAATNLPLQNIYYKLQRLRDAYREQELNMRTLMYLGGYSKYQTDPEGQEKEDRMDKIKYGGGTPKNTKYKGLGGSSSGMKVPKSSPSFKGL